MTELDRIKADHPFRKRPQAAASEMKQDYVRLIASVEVGPCIPACCPRTTCPGHVLAPSCDYRVVVQDTTQNFYFDRHLSDVTKLLNEKLAPAQKGTAIKSLLDRVFSKV